MARRSKKWTKVDWVAAPDIKRKVVRIKKELGLSWLNSSRIFCMRSTTSSARAYARIWGLNKVWQLALTQKPAYIIEVLSQNFDHLSLARQEEILLHEIVHIPKNFSGSLMPHTRRGKNPFHDKVHELINRNKHKKKIKIDFKKIKLFG